MKPVLEHVLKSKQFTAEERQQWQSQFNALGDELRKQRTMTPDLQRQISQWNAQVKMAQQVLESKGDSQSSDIWRLVFPLGRMNGSKPGSELHSTFKLDLGAGNFERNFALVTNPLNQAGSGHTDALPLTQHSPNTIPAGDDVSGLAPPDQAYGQYAVKYVMNAQVSNTTDQERLLDIRFGTADEMGDTGPDSQGRPGWVSLFDNLDSQMSELTNTRARFTGVVRVTVNGGPPQDISIAHGRVQNPELLQRLKLPPMRPGDKPYEVSVELFVPTNNTGPHIVQFSSAEAAQ